MRRSRPAGRRATTRTQKVHAILFMAPCSSQSTDCKTGTSRPAVASRYNVNPGTDGLPISAGLDGRRGNTDAAVPSCPGSTLIHFRPRTNLREHPVLVEPGLPAPEYLWSVVSHRVLRLHVVDGTQVPADIGCRSATLGEDVTDTIR